MASMELAISVLAAHSYATVRMCDDIIVTILIKLGWMLLVTVTTEGEVFEYQHSAKGGGAWQRDGGSFNKDPRAPLP